MPLVEIASQIVAFASLKIAASFILVFAFFFGDFHAEGVLAVLVLVVFDTIMGTMASVSEGKAITSRRFSMVVRKASVYFISISAGYFTDQTIGLDALQLVQPTLIAFIATTELISILENAGRMGYQTPKKLLNQLKDFQSLK